MLEKNKLKARKLKMTDKLAIKDSLITQVVARPRKFGFFHVNEVNITTDEVYSLFLLKILKKMFGKNSETDLEINHILKIMDVESQIRG